MRDDIPPAAFRLMAQLPVRQCHGVNAPRSAPDPAAGPSNAREVKVQGVVYESVTEAARRLGISREAVRNRMRLKPGQTRFPAHNRRAVIVHGKRYESIREAWMALDASPNTIYRMLDKGLAQYA